MNEKDKKRFESIQQEFYSCNAVAPIQWLCSLVEELEAEVARLNDALKLTDTYSEGLEAELAKAKGQRDKLASAVNRATYLLRDFGINAGSHVCNPGCWMCRAKSVLIHALAELEKKT